MCNVRQAYMLLMLRSKCTSPEKAGLVWCAVECKISICTSALQQIMLFMSAGERGPATFASPHLGRVMLLKLGFLPSCHLDA